MIDTEITVESGAAYVRVYSVITPLGVVGRSHVKLIDLELITSATKFCGLSDGTVKVKKEHWMRSHPYHLSGLYKSCVPF